MMTESDLPDPGTATETADAGMTFAEGVSGIADLIEDPETDLLESDEAEGADETALEEDGLEEPETEGEDTSEDVDEEAADEGADGSEEPEIKGGRFAPDTAKVTLEDGTVITVAELKRNNLFQRDYTKKTMELATEREQVTKFKSEVDQYAQQLDQFREFGEWLTQQFGIQDPGPYRGAPNDPVAYYEHLQRKEQYEAIANGFQQFKASQQQLTEKQREQAQIEGKKRGEQELAALHEKMPALKDPEKNKAFWSRLEKGAEEHYGLSSDMVRSIGDHRMALILRDALEFKRLKSAAPKVQEQVRTKPKLVTGGKRPNPQATQNRDKQVRAERLRKTGDFNLGVEALMDLDL